MKRITSPLPFRSASALIALAAVLGHALPARAFDPNVELKRIEVPAIGVSFEIPADWVEETREGTRTWHAPGADPEAVFSIQLIDNTAGASNLDDQVAQLRAEIEGLPRSEVLADDENAFANLASHMMMGKFQPSPGKERGMLWVLVSRAQHFYWISLAFPPGQWKDGYATLMDRIVNGFRFTALYETSIAESNRIAREFLHEVRDGRLDEAYARTNDVFRKATSREDFSSFIRSNPTFTNFQWFRIWENAGNYGERLLLIELEGRNDDMVPLLHLSMKLEDQRDFVVETMFSNHAQKVSSTPINPGTPGFSKVSIEKAGFTGAFPVGWLMTVEALPGGVTRFLFRPQGGGMERDRRGIVAMIAEGGGGLSEILESYLQAYAGLPGFLRGEEISLKIGDGPTVGSVFRLETEDDRGVAALANSVTVLQSPSGRNAVLHITMEAEESAEKFEEAFQPVLDHFRLLK